MDQNHIKVSSYIIQIVAEKLKTFIKENEVSFKFHPWQMTTTLNEINKVLNTGLHERSLHYLLDTGAARELLNFSKKKKCSSKGKQVADYLYAYLGLQINQYSSKEKGSSYIRSENRNIENIFQYSLTKKSIGVSRVFEIKKLVEAVSQELAYLLAENDRQNHSTQYSWKMSKFHLGVVKKQKLACCTSPDCLINSKKALCEKRLKNNRKRKIKKIIPTGKNFITQNIRRYKILGYSPRYKNNTFPRPPEPTTLVAEKKPQQKLPRVRPKITVEIATQTMSWRRNKASMSYQESPTAISDEEEEESDFYDSEDDFYCKSDTLNDASMITEEIASDYLVGKTATSQAKSENSRSNIAVQSGSSEERPSMVEKQPSMSRHRSLTVSRHSSKKHRATAVRRQSRVTSLGTRTTNSLKASFGSKRDKTCSSRDGTAHQDAKSLRESEVVLDKTHSDASLKKYGSVCANGDLSRDGSGMEKQEAEEDANQKLEPFDEAENQDVEKLDVEVEADGDTLEENEEVDGDVIADPEEKEEDTDKKVNDEADKNVETEVSDKQLLRVMSSSDNETTYLPVVSSGTGSLEDSYASSSAKENDAMSPDFSSHWTEEYTSTEVSDSELVDESFQEKFIAYKSSLLDDDEDASSEGETRNDDVYRDSEVSNGTNDISTVVYNEILEALETGNLDKFKELLQSDCENISMYLDERGRNFLHIASSKGYERIVEELINYGLPLENCTSEGYTALHLAILNNHLKCCQVLLENGAALSERNSPEKVDASSPVKRFLTKYEENLGKVKKLSEVLSHFGKKSKIRSSGLSKNLLRTLTDLSLEDDDERSDTSAL